MVETGTITVVETGTITVEPNFVLRIREAHHAGQRSRKRVSGGLLAAGVPVAFLAMGVGLYLHYRNSGSSKPSYAYFVLSLVPPAWSLCALALLPTDIALIRAVGDISTTALLLASGFFCLLIAKAAKGEVDIRDLSCRASSSQHCWVLLLSYSAWTVTFAVLMVWILVLNRPRPGMPGRWSSASWRLIIKAMRTYSSEHGLAKFALLFVVVGFPGSCPGFWLGRNDDYYALPARVALRHAWRGVRCFSVAAALIVCLAAVSLSVIHGADDSDAISRYVFGMSLLLFMGLLPSSRNRRWIIGTLKRLTQTAEERQAAAIGAFIGQMGSRRAFEYASRTFCVIGGDQLSASDFGKGFIHVVVKGDTDATHQARALRGRTRLAELGDGDAFISHSWRDDGQEKWQVIERWKTSFEESRGRAPAFWCDIACIDEQRLEDSLAALPLYLAGCHRLLALVGPSFTTRLWCIMELCACPSTSSRKFLGRAPSCICPPTARCSPTHDEGTHDIGPRACAAQMPSYGWEPA